MKSNSVRTSWAVVGMLNLVSFTIGMESYAINLAAPTLIDSLSLGLTTLMWVINAYMVALASTLVVAGRLGDRFGSTRILLLGLGVFVLGSASCAVATNGTFLVAGRAVQGLGAGLVTPHIVSLTFTVTPVHRRGFAFGLGGMVAGVAVAAGPTVGGLLTTLFGWRSIFWVTVPLGVVAGALLWRWAPRPGPQKAAVDIAGAALSTLSIAGLAISLLHAGQGNIVVVAAPLTLVAVTALAFQQRGRRDGHALLPFELLGHRMFLAMTVVAASLPAAVTAMFFLSAYVLQHAGLSPADAGLVLAIAPAVSVPCAVLGGRWTDRPRGARQVSVTGLICFLLGTIWIMATLGSGPSALVPGLVVFGIGMGVVFAGPVNLGLATLPDKWLGVASGIFSTGQRIGSVIGAALVGLTLQATADLGPLQAARWAFSAPLALLVLALSIVLGTRQTTTHADGPPLLDSTPGPSRPESVNGSP
ncbi:MFS transporter [Streptomyces aureoverticillatus]|nr:MFS transporter [Streptomyces aureoverticillatus]